MFMDRKSGAPLSPQELAAIRRLRGNPRHPTSTDHRQIFLSMNLVAVTANGLKLTEAGFSQLMLDEQGSNRPSFDWAFPRIG